MLEQVKIAADVITLLEKQGLLQKLAAFIRREEPVHVLMMGASGTGKSALLQKISGEEPFIRRFERSHDTEERSGMLSGEKFRIETTPGQLDDVHKANRLRAIREAAGSKHLGIVNVVSYGFHEGLAAEHEVFADGKVRADYLEAHRKEEIGLLSEWTDLLCAPGGAADWVITIVTKADLWWGTDLQKPVLDYYHGGEYLRALGSAAKLPHSVHAYSTLNQKFYGRLPPSGEYEDEQRRRDHNQLVATLIGYASR